MLLSTGPAAAGVLLYVCTQLDLLSLAKWTLQNRALNQCSAELTSGGVST